jgi:hypothetical protein
MLKKIVSLAKFFITFKKRVTWEVPYCKILGEIIFQQVIHNTGMEKRITIITNSYILYVNKMRFKKAIPITPYIIRNYVKVEYLSKILNMLVYRN